MSEDLDSGESDIVDFTVDKKVVDNLKLDASILTPEQDAVIKNIIRSANEKLVQMYGEYIPDEIAERVSGVEDRIIVTDSDAYRELFLNWQNFHNNLVPPGNDSGAFFGLQGRIIAINDPSNVWEDFVPEEDRQRLTEYFGSEEKARIQTTWMALADYSIHELVHQYEDTGLPEAFKECGARYYQREISKALDYGYLEGDLQEKRINYYRELVQTHGDSVHRLFFSGKAADDGTENQIKRSFILGRTAEERERLFPKGKGLLEQKEQGEKESK